jgi:hypothetical protein
VRILAPRRSGKAVFLYGVNAELGEGIEIRPRQGVAVDVNGRNGHERLLNVRQTIFLGERRSQSQYQNIKSGKSPVGSLSVQRLFVIVNDDYPEKRSQSQNPPYPTLQNAAS